jgi:hypothetical protein
MFFSDYSGIFSKFNGQFGSHRNIPNLPVLQFGANCYQPLTAVEIMPAQSKDFSYPHFGCERDQCDHAFVNFLAATLNVGPLGVSNCRAFFWIPFV